MTTLVTTSEERGVTTLTLNSPATRNALSAALVTELADALTACGKDPGVRAVVLDHAGTTFSAGADLKSPPSPYDFVALLRQIVELPKPVVARVTGHARAGGLGLLGACDVVVAGEEADFALTEVRIGVAPAVISLTLLPRLEPRAAARHYLTGERFGVAEAIAMGLVTAGDDALDGILDALRAASPQGLRESKRLVTAKVLETFERDAEDLVQRSATLFASAEAREGMTAFLERRDPAWRL
ncbi:MULTISPECIES: enoyl-CoA hydratase family protein [unclassified Streptomyces]|uniref:enoyl-CoA hydratase family protein n=1 Tax=unclassified Streptomyces TaxID=2593676 RepID=UPI0006AFF8F8|nr:MULTISPECIES: enoyl-CoA hydratase family protein [unclassified Streptomyces]KOX21098.1 enoyl-CoA hydratase [Streptomyces sp. NRRL F-6491]KOX41096.1 enoyl-CoA hydratase [Streptomyces sp. NRRL F-6492]